MGARRSEKAPEFGEYGIRSLSPLMALRASAAAQTEKAGFQPSATFRDDCLSTAQADPESTAQADPLQTFAPGFARANYLVIDGR